MITVAVKAGRVRRKDSLPPMIDDPGEHFFTFRRCSTSWQSPALLTPVHRVFFAAASSREATTFPIWQSATARPR
jgi:hypothetical protein